MTTIEGAVLGRAVFATTRGLVAESEGVLAGADASLFEMGFGRDRDSVFHRIEPGLGIYFARRLDDQYRGTSYNLFGAVSPCRDSDMRRGFFGAAVCLPIDIKESFSIADWKVALNILDEDFTRIHGQLYGDEPQINWQKFFASAPRTTASLTPASGKDIFLHTQRSASDAQNQSTVIKTLQSMMYFHAEKYSTVCVFLDPMQDTLSVDDDQVRGTVYAFEEMKTSIASRGQERARQAAPKGSSPHSHLHSEVSKVMATEDQTRRIEDLEEQVARLNDAVRELQDEIFPQQTQARRPPPNDRVGGGLDGGLIQKETTPDFRMYAAVIGGAILLVIVLVIILVFAFRSSGDLEIDTSLDPRPETDETLPAE